MKTLYVNEMKTRDIDLKILDYVSMNTVKIIDYKIIYLIKVTDRMNRECKRGKTKILAKNAYINCNKIHNHILDILDIIILKFVDLHIKIRLSFRKLADKVKDYLDVFLI